MPRTTSHGKRDVHFRCCCFVGIEETGESIGLLSHGWRMKYGTDVDAIRSTEAQPPAFRGKNCTVGMRSVGQSLMGSSE